MPTTRGRRERREAGVRLAAVSTSRSRLRSVGAAATLAALLVGCAPPSTGVSLTEPVDTTRLRGTAATVITFRLGAQFTTGDDSGPNSWRAVPTAGNFSTNSAQVAAARRQTAGDGTHLRVDRTANTLTVVRASGESVVELVDPLSPDGSYTEIRQQWSPDGSKVVVIRAPYGVTPAQEFNAVYDARSGSLLGAPFAGSGYRSVNGAVTWETVAVAWKPDSLAIAFSEGDRVMTMPMAIGAAAAVVATLPRSAGSCPQVQDWSSFDRLLFLCSNDPVRPFSGAKRLFSIPAVGGPVRVLDAGLADLSAPDPQLSARYMPDTDQVVFTRAVQQPIDFTTIWNSSVYVVDDAPGSSLRVISTASPTIVSGVRLADWAVIEGFLRG